MAQFMLLLHQVPNYNSDLPREKMLEMTRKYMAWADGLRQKGKMVGGEVVNKQTIGREDALIAHTRSNAYFVFQEDNLGSIARGVGHDRVSRPVRTAENAACRRRLV